MSVKIWPKTKNGTDNEVSYRLDHPHFQSVCKTKYAKGTIIDFYKISDNPLSVKSLVKVRVGDISYDQWVPIFYEPRDMYWDDDESKAKEFDESNKFFKKAWMSFRGGDEVVVLMEYDIDDSVYYPKYVIGFYDNYPRTGENLFKYKTVDYSGKVGNRVVYVNTMDYSIYGILDDENDMGPDGKEIVLDEKCIQCITDIKQPYKYRFYLSGWIGGYNYCLPGMGKIEVKPNVWCCEDYNLYVWFLGEKYEHNDSSFIFKEYMFVIGPKLYVLQIIGTYMNVSFSRYWEYYLPYPCLEVPENLDSRYIRGEYDSDNEVGSKIGLSPALIVKNIYTSYDVFRYGIDDVNLYAGIYTPELADKVIQRSREQVLAYRIEDYYIKNYSRTQPADYNWDLVWPFNYDGLLTYQTLKYKTWEAMTNVNDTYLLDPSVELSVAPHTMEELIRAGLVEWLKR